MNIIQAGKVAGSIAAIVALGGGVWAFGDDFGFRPALKSELLAVAEDVQVVSNSVAWVQLENYERRMRRGVKLSRQECARYRALAKSLGVSPKAC